VNIIFLFCICMMGYFGCILCLKGEILRLSFNLNLLIFLSTIIVYFETKVDYSRDLAKRVLAYYK